MPTLHNHLSAPVVLVTKGRGREVYQDSRELFRRLAEIPALKDRILSIQTPVSAVTKDGIAALETMLWLCGFTCFERAAKRKGNPFGRAGTRWNWSFLSEYLGWEWKALRE